jgi:hypothetical protein
LDVTIPAVLNFILLLICNEIYEKIAEELTYYENHKTINDYEMNFVIKKYLLTFISLCGPILEIIFTHRLVGLKCADNDCYKHA